mmetsp:Transcript_43425/g.114447  ORF Transcript_43425/g.114447 Transcript_43425/m.114447 type:complete len:413 (-) Transcript_43425:220-1458(-)
MQDVPAEDTSGADAAVYDAAFFNRPLDRVGFHSVKYDLRELFHGDGAAECIPLTLADMDLPCAPEISAAVRQRSDHPTFGYTLQPGVMWAAVQQWLQDEHNWNVTLDAFTFVAHSVLGFSMCLWAFTDPGDTVLVMTPLYDPLQKAVEGAKRRLRKHELALDAGRYVLHRDVLHRDLQGCRAMVLCNPQNPSGRVWDRAELLMVAELCKEHGVLVISDDVWCDWVLGGARYTPFALVARDSGPQTVTLMGPSKTWSLAGLHSSFVVIEDEVLRQKYVDLAAPAFLSHGTVFATEATIAAYTYGRPWLDGVRVHVESNLVLCREVLAPCAPEVVPMWPESTYLVWLDCRELDVPDAAEFFKEEARVLLNDGFRYGGGSCAKFVRMNVATSRHVLGSVLARIVDAVLTKRGTKC